MNEVAEKVRTRQDLVEFVELLAREAGSSGGEAWENATLPRYLEALPAWAADLDGYCANTGQEVPSEPSWRLLAEMLPAATIYE